MPQNDPLFLTLFTVLLLLYAFLIFLYAKTWKQIPPFHPSTPRQLVKVTVVIPARNEEKNIGNLIQALKAQDYPLTHLEILVVDDDSTDDTARIAEGYEGIKILMLGSRGGNAHKKQALAAGIAASAGEFIVCTDADCIPKPAWISTLVSFRETTGKTFLVAPVALAHSGGLLSCFQLLDFLVLQGITAASAQAGIHPLCNGANLSYDKSLYESAGGFDHIDHIASGDDMLLMKKVMDRFPETIGYVHAKEALVTSLPQPGLRSFFQQRIRWSSKATHYRHINTLLVLALVYIFNVSLLALFVTGFFLPVYFLHFLAAWILKTVFELQFMIPLTRFFQVRNWLIPFFLFQPLHIFYTVLAGSFGQFRTYQWKGRRVR